MRQNILGLMNRAVEKVQGTSVLLYSGAGHDAAAMAAVTPVSMLFVRCKEGLSHHPDESVRTEDVAVALETMKVVFGGVGEGANRVSKTYDVLIRGGILVTASGERRADVGIAGGKIVEIGEGLAGSAKEAIDASGLHVFPGLIDSHVHFNDPGRAHWEGVATGSRACAAGGGTTYFDMPLNSSPPTLDAESFDKKLAANCRAIGDRFWSLGRADAEQPGASGGAGGTRRGGVQSLHVEQRHRGFCVRG